MAWRARDSEKPSHDIWNTGHDDEKESEAAQNHGIEQKPDVPTVPSVVESIPKESEGVESPDTAPGQPEPAEVPPTADPLPLEDDPPKISPNKSFTYLHGPTILDYTPER